MAFYLYVVLAFVAACYAEAASNVASSFVCKSNNAYYKIDASCDSYIQCNGYVPTTLTCPDGLHYNPDVKWPNYPCGYPMDVPCLGRATQPAQSTPDCPHKYGYFQSPIASSEDCGHFRLCVDGHPMEMECPSGLAFNPSSGRCDWPDQVPSCKANDFLGFSCPPAPLGENGELLDVIYNFKHPDSCFYFFSCQQGRARLLSCDPGLAFDAASSRCVDEDLVHCSHQ
ncbi:unnamed protein product [Arctia plantaginis]|uniref:Chitin-binding type-2 domain-containing protein n=1 Tax=Arctia plantaginis TaxID=874455 RepID=A0A8S0ZT42_ARCPL|nr:unnamed protein product [Arctia plantaginis]CAB3238663.1 unnamed protein product [Arctia plantaginis]